jgi:hypothetical protein
MFFLLLIQRKENRHCSFNGGLPTERMGKLNKNSRRFTGSQMHTPFLGISPILRVN